ncbi:MAG: sulfite exporter TauE/SafE family protein [Candidatus Omnitrophica bacterium]|nr:sulfite exporter TauE/SafE family protein [Candidatus Omnitrophota bacterium]
MAATEISLLRYLQAFIGGVVISFTPCVYPLIPIIIGSIGIKDGITSKIKGLYLSFTYASGLSVTYSALGMVASLTGGIFGRISSHPITLIIVGLIIILFGLSMFDLFFLPAIGFKKLPVIKQRGFWSVFFLGLSSGLVVAPCTTPVLGAILAYLATKKNILYGTTLLLTFAYGMSLVLILAGTFSAFLMNIPKPGKWTVYVKKVSSLLLIMMGIYFIISGIRIII